MWVVECFIVAGGVFTGTYAITLSFQRITVFCRRNVVKAREIFFLYDVRLKFNWWVQRVVTEKYGFGSIDHINDAWIEYLNVSILNQARR